MKIVILAAGKGSRLGRNELPKPLALLEDGNSILQHQINVLEKFFSREEIILVVGYHKELMMEAFDDLFFVYNPHYALENTSKSLLRAIRKVHEDLLWINGDVLFHPIVIEKLLKADRNCMAVTAGPVGDEEVKYRSDAAGKICEVSKAVQNAQGEAVGVNLFKASSLPLLQQHLERCQSSDFFEMAIEKAILAGLEVWCCPIESSHCAEIDFPEDLEHANRLLNSWRIVR